MKEHLINNKSKIQYILRIGIIFILLLVMFLGVIYAVSNLPEKGELNDDGEVNYADVSLLQLHLIHLQELPEDKLENADMNNDGKITVTDLTLLIQKIEKQLDYEVDITELKASNYYPNKNEEIEISFDADVNYDATIKNITINNEEYDVKKEENTSKYSIKINVGNTSGVKEYKLTGITLNNGKTIKIDYTIQIDVLKQAPQITNYKVEEDVGNSKLKAIFKVEDPEETIILGNYEIIEDKKQNLEVEVEDEGQEQENKIIQLGEITAGDNEIEFTAEEGKHYKLRMYIKYDLDTNTLQTEIDNIGNITEEKDLSLIEDYNFEISNIETFRNKNDNLEKADEFDIGETIVIKFDSTNITQYIPEKAVINGKLCELSQEGNNYVANAEGLKDTGNQTVNIEKIILNNGKTFEVNKEVQVNIIKKAPTVESFKGRENLEIKIIDVMLQIRDDNKSITNLTVKLFDENDNEVSRDDITAKLNDSNLQEIENDGQVLNVYNIMANLETKNMPMANKYKIKLFASYCLLENNENYTYTDKLIEEYELEALPIVNIQNVEVSNKYPEKGENIELTYKIETNKEASELTGITINNLKCKTTSDVDEDGNITYSAIIEAGDKAGILEINTTEFSFEHNLTAKVEHQTQVDVLKTRPTSEAFLQEDDIENNSVTLTANIIDPDKALISGKADLVKDDTQEIVATKEFDSENITFTINDVELDTKYTLVAKMTYDRDTNTIEEETNKNYVKDEIFRRRPIQLIADYELEISNIKTYNEQKETKYFAKGEQVIVGFNSSNKTEFYPVKAVINGVEYELQKQGEEYRAKIQGENKFGPRDITIEKVILNNTKGLDITENNKTKVGTLKDKPTVTKFAYAEQENNVIEVSFQLNDDDETITGGNIIITDENGTEIKRETLTDASNGISFNKGTSEEYIIKVIADYDLDTNAITTGENEYQNQELLVEEINISTERLFEMKDITGVTLYRGVGESTEEVSSIREQDLNDLNNYIVKVQMKEMPTFYSEIEEYKIEDDKLKFVLDYDNLVQYENGKKQNKLTVTYGDMKDGVAGNKSIKSLLQEMEENPDGTFELSQDYDFSSIQDNTNTIIATEFRGTLNGNGHKITGLSKPLFNTLESANIQNLILEDVTLTKTGNQGAIANVATNTTIKNTHIKNLTFTTSINKSGSLVGELNSGCTIEECSVTNFKITLNHIRVGGIVGNITGSTIRNCYIQGTINSITSKDGISGIVGTGESAATSTIENCISKVEFLNNTRASNNGGIIGLAIKSNVVLKNNVSLNTGTGINKVHGSTIHSTSTNNYELEESELISNASGDRVKIVSKSGLTQEFFKNTANFNEDIWDLSNVSYDNIPKLKNDDPSKEEETLKQEDNQLYIPEYNRIKDNPGFSKTKEKAYHNIQKLMPFYDSKYLVVDGSKIAEDDILNTKIIKYILPYDNEGKLVTYLTSEDYQKIKKIKILFKDNTVNEYNVNFKELKQNIVIHDIDGLDLMYAYNNYTIKPDANIINTIVEYINGVDYTATLDPLTTAADSRLYKDHYNETMKAQAQNIAMQLLQNDENSLLVLDNNILKNKIKQELINSGKINRILYGYNYYYRWYNFEIGGTKVSDIMLFEGEMFSKAMTIDNLVNEVLSGNIATNNTAGFYNNNISKYTGSSNLGYFLDFIINKIGGYEDVNDWFTEFFPTKGILAEITVDDRPDLQYRAWCQMKKYSNFILPLTTLPKDAGYIISGPAQLQVGALRVYNKDPQTEAGRKAIENIVKQHCALVKRQFTTLAGTFDSERWNNYCIMVYDCCKVITGYKTSYIPGTNIPLGTYAVYTTCKVGTTEPFHKNFNEAVGAWQYGSAAGVGNTAGFLWFIATPGLTNYDTWTHEYQHALADKIMLFQRGTRLQLEAYTEGNVEQRQVWSNNAIEGYDVGPYYFNLAFTLNKEALVTQNLTPERINTREKLENYYKGQQNALDLLDYVSAKAFIQLTPEEQSKIATRMSQSGAWSSWGTITAQQAEDMNLTTLESLWDNRIILRPNNAWGVSVRGLVPITGIGANDYGYESVWVTRWYIGHNDNGQADALSVKRNLFEMLGYGGVDGYVMYGSRQSKTDLDAIQKITKSVTGKEMNWKEYKLSRYAEIESKLDNKYINADFMIEKFTEALQADARGNNRNITAATNLRKIYYHYLKRATNDFVTDPLGTDLQMTHITTAQELIEKINANPYGYYILDNDIDFTGITNVVTSTFMGKLDGNGHKIIGNTNSIFQKIRFGYVKNLKFEGTNIPKDITNIGVLAKQTQYSILEDIDVKNVKINFAGRNDLSVIGGAVSVSTYTNCNVEHTVTQISSKEDFLKIQEDSSGIFNITSDIDFAGYTSTSNAVITETFTGKIQGNGHTISNLNNLSLFANFRGTVENLNISNFTNTSAGRGNGDFVTAFTQESFTATFKNMKFDNITLSGRNNVAVITGMDGRENANSVFENISVKNSNVTGTGVYVSNFAGRKYGGLIKNVYVQGTLNVTGTENGGLVGAMQQGGTIENVITDVDIIKSSNSWSNIANSVFNASFIGNIYNSPKVNNCIAFGNMTGYTDNSGTKFAPYKFTGAAESQVVACLTNCYEVDEEVGFSRVSNNTDGKLNSISKSRLNADFYKSLGFDEEFWNLNSLTDKGYPRLK